MNNKYYQYLEEINSLNSLEQIIYELVMFQKNEKFINLYNESTIEQEEKIVDKEIDKIDKIAKKFSIKYEEVPLLKKAFVTLAPELKQTIDNYLFDLKIATSFGLGIGSLIPSIMLFLNKTQISISRENAILLAVGVILGVFYTRKKEIRKIDKMFKKLFFYIKNKKLRNTIKIIKLISIKMWIPVDKFMEFLAYTIMAIPMSNFFVSFLQSSNFNPVLVKQSLEGLATGGLIHLLRKIGPKLLFKFSSFFKKRR